MGTVTSVINLKGGAGKTTLALSLVSAWREKGKKSILIDADGGQRTAADILGIGAARGEDVIELVQLTDWKLLRKQARAFAKDYDRVVIDTPGRLGKVSSVAISASDLVLMPVCPGPAGQLSMGPTIDLIDEWNVLAEVPARAAIVLNQIDRRTKVGLGHRPTVEDLLSDREAPPILLRSELRDLADHEAAQSEGESVVEYAPRGDAAQEVRALVAEIENRRLFRRSKR